jgi:hypothetical protein
VALMPILVALAFGVLGFISKRILKIILRHVGVSRQHHRAITTTITALAPSNRRDELQRNKGSGQCQTPQNNYQHMLERSN